MRPTRRSLWIATAGVVLALLPVFVSAGWWPLWAGFWCAFALSCGADALLARRAVAVQLEAPATLFVGVDTSATLVLDVRADRPLQAEVVLDLKGELHPVPRLEATVQGSASLPFTLCAWRRGQVAIERAWVRVHGPLGLALQQHILPLEHTLAVLPDIRPVREVALRLTMERSLRTGLKIERYRGDGTEFDALREYHTGDDPRTIHWRASARHHRLVCRQFRAERNHQVVLAVDTGHLMSEPVAGTPKVDHALSAALLLAYVSLKSGDRVGFYTFDATEGIFAEPTGGTRAHHRLVHLSSEVSYSQAETNFTLGLTRLSERLRRRSLVVVLSDFVDTVTAQLMVENLDRLSRRHLVLFVALRDPAIEGLVDAFPQSMLAVTRAVVAAGFRRDREVVMQRLRRLGVHCLDAPPNAVGPQLLNQYLDIKRRELI